KAEPVGFSLGTEMKTIFVFVKCKLGHAYDVADAAVQSLEAVSEVHSISGQHDLFLKFYLPGREDIGRDVTEQVQTLPGVTDTFTIIALQSLYLNSSLPLLLAGEVASATCASG